MPDIERSALPPTGDLQAAIQAIQEEVVKMAASGSRQNRSGQGATDHRRSRTEAGQASRSASAPASSSARPVLRVLSGPSSGQADSRADHRADADRHARKLLTRGFRQRRVRLDPISRAPQVVVAQALVRSITEEIHAGTTVIGGWVELLERGMLTEDELAIACQRVRSAQARIELASEQLELAVGINRKLLH